VTHNRQISHARGPNCPPLVAQGYGDWVMTARSCGAWVMKT
jgi:hypothetical protein